MQSFHLALDTAVSAASITHFFCLYLLTMEVAEIAGIFSFLTVKEK